MEQDLAELNIPDDKCLPGEHLVDADNLTISYVTYQGRRLVRLALGTDDATFLAEVDAFMRTQPHGAIANFAGFYLQKRIIYHSDMPNGTLQHLFEQVATGTSPAWWNATAKAKVFYGIAAAMMHLHAQEMYHRCLTPICFMFDQNYEVRLSHFQCPSVPEFASKSRLPDEPMWRAPETYNADGSERELSCEDMPATDVFSFGMIMLQLISGKALFPGESGDAIRAKVAKGEMPRLDKDGQELAVAITESCLKENPRDRPVFCQIVYALEHNTEALFPGVDMEAFTDYRRRIFSETIQSMCAAELFSKAPGD